MKTSRPTSMRHALTAALLLTVGAAPGMSAAATLEPCDKNHYILSDDCLPGPLASWTWSPTGRMQVPRWGHTATLLHDGRVLVAGGMTPDTSEAANWYDAQLLSTAELFDPATGAWTPAGVMGQAREFHGAVLLADGRLLVAGGFDANGITASAALYDPASDSWSTTASLRTRRAGHTMTLLASGEVLVFGGSNEDSANDGDFPPLGSAEIYDPLSAAWRDTGTLRTARIQTTTALLADGNVLVASGDRSVEWHMETADAELYDSLSGTWSAAGVLAVARACATSVKLDDGSVLVAGGYSPRDYNLYSYVTTDRYVPGIGWRAAANLHTPRASHTMTRLASGHVVVTGGLDWGGGTPVWLSSAEVYDPARASWDRVQSLPMQRDGHTATALADGRLLLVGGFTRSLFTVSAPSLSSAEIFGPPAR